MVREHDKVGIHMLLAAPPTPLCKALVSSRDLVLSDSFLLSPQLSVLQEMEIEWSVKSLHYIYSTSVNHYCKEV